MVYLNLFRKKYFYLILILLILLGIFFIWYFLIFDKSNYLKVKAGNCIFKVEIADNEQEKYQGLSNRDYLNFDQGMLFLFSPATDVTFVMREMNFPLDIIFIRNHRIVNLYHNAQPEEKNLQNSYNSGFPIDAVLEIKAGRSRDCHLGIGSEIIW